MAHQLLDRSVQRRQNEGEDRLESYSPTFDSYTSSPNVSTHAYRTRSIEVIRK